MSFFRDPNLFLVLLEPFLLLTNLELLFQILGPYFAFCVEITLLVLLFLFLPFIIIDFLLLPHQFVFFVLYYSEVILKLLLACHALILVRLIIIEGFLLCNLNGLGADQTTLMVAVPLGSYADGRHVIAINIYYV